MEWEAISGGEIASKLAVEEIKKYINKNFKNIVLEKELILNLINDAIEHANKVVYQKAKSNKDLSEMGTTIEVCLVYQDKVYIGHIGDSRIYRIRKNIIRKLTTDHSYVEKLIKDGTITREQSYNHPEKNMLTKALGCDSEANPDVFVKAFLKGDILLICSDGLTNMVSENEIYGILKTDINTAKDNLIKRANDNGGLDNTTVIIIEN